MKDAAAGVWKDRRFTYRPWVGQTVQIGSLICIVWAIFVGISAGWWLLAFGAYFVISCLGFAVCVHRGLCHRAFVAKPLVENVLSFCAAAGMTGSPMGWIGTHRTHHAHADRPDDPHAPEDHGWWLIWTGPDLKIDWWRIRDLLRSRFQRFLHRYYLVVIGVWIVCLAALHPLAVIFGFIIPAGLHVTVSNLSTILGHGYGYRNHDTKDHSKNCVWLAILTWGEGWHNNHHANPVNWSLSEKWWEVDLAGLCIRFMTAAGLIDRRSFREAI